MSFIHHSEKPLRLRDLEDRDPERYATDRGCKPHGLWFSVGDGADWRALVTARWPRSNGIRCWTEVVLAAKAIILRLTAADDIDAFTTEYARTGDNESQSIEWARVASEVDGIIIASHCRQRESDNETRWYGCWEVSCGCVWRTRAVECLRPINY